MNELIEDIKRIEDCKVLPPSNQPILFNYNHILPADLRRFYELCGGITLFESASYAMTIVQPNDFVLANPVIVGELCEYDRSSDWYVIGTDGSSQYITIDLSYGRCGKCYDSFYEVHGVAGSNAIIANSFTDLLRQLLESKGQYLYWVEDDFEALGDAYDSI
ncbi:SMI1/KNR4 family protein [Paenibacillus lupini]|uniref:SMI1/KNR4 family protein n=1 Tax=Paenibacillus lupini TaxID=1450204 RepID=UPI00141E7AC0